MSEKELPMVSQTQADQPTAGQLLREAREAAGLHVAALAGVLKVPVHKLEALEANDFAAFPDTVFVRALALSICRSLRLDAEPILAKLPRSEPKGFAAQSMQLNAPIKERAGGGGMAASSSGVSRKALGAVLVLLLGAAAIYFMPDGALDKAVEGSPVTLPQPVEVVPTPAAALPAEQLEATLPVESAAQPEPAPEPMVPAAALSAPSAVPAQPAAAQPVAAAAEADMLVFHAPGTSWVTETDSKGGKLLDRRLDAGETVRMSANPPLSVVVGRSDLTTVQLRGQAFDLTALSRKNVGRFEVKE